ncbi:MAG: tRNA (adenosine(37)-N6)-threonylcarbamoyltransferase complex dimerization subunit type 1 TsaB [Pseudomonadaceae bacterium]|nr:tRNA (adenosine(37)-N6)-threonylcarbamoyltransferase complex dimerization subunit type 1 TsaB [Pseudomonadaceae bacterium]
MINTLCIETSGPHCSLALAVDGHIYRRDELLERTHNQYLLPLLDELLTQAGIKPVQIELVSFGCGPGSFTGVRIAAAAAQAIATASAAKVVPLSSAWILAATAFMQDSELQQVICFIPSRGQAFYTSAYRRMTDEASRVPVYQQSQVDELVDQPTAWLLSEASDGEIQRKTAFAGKLPTWLPESLQTRALDVIYPQATVMVAEAQAQHLAGNSVAAQYGLPQYFTGDSPWRKSHEPVKTAGKL